jgi:DNA-binding MarR family transcriptional regulator
MNSTSRAPEFRECLGCSCFAARRAARTITQHYERVLKPSGLRVTQFTVLSMLAAAGPQTVTGLAGQLATERTTLTRNVRALVTDGLVAESATGDGRVRLLSITKRGLNRARAALPHWREAQKSIARRLGPGAIRALATASQAAAMAGAGRS